MKKVFAYVTLLWFGLTISYAQSSQPIELLKNPSFEEEAKPIRNRRFGPNGEGELFGARLPVGVIPGWIVINEEESAADIEISTENLLDTTQHKALRWEFEKGAATIANVGLQGIEVVNGHQYTLTLWARADKKYKGKIQVGLQSKHDGIWYAQAKIKGKIKKRWKKHTITFTAEGNDAKARLVMTADKPGTIYLDCMSLTIAD
jgi:hypothetical protein